jgi:putative phosphoesterase
VTRILVLADTHIRPGRRYRLPDSVYRELDRTDLVLHAGDLVVPDVLHELSGFAPVHAVLGNNDVGELVDALPETVELEAGGVRVAMVHDSGPRAGRERRLRRRFPEADIVVFGHSHIPWNEAGNGQRLFNPGSPTERRRQPQCTYGMIEIECGSVDARVLPIG